MNHSFVLVEHLIEEQISNIGTKQKLWKEDLAEGHEIFESIKCRKCSCIPKMNPVECRHCESIFCEDCILDLETAIKIENQR